MKQDRYEDWFSDLDDRSIEEIAADVPALDDAARDRIEALCEEKMRMRDMKTGNEEIVYAGNIQNITRTQWFRPAVTAAACLVLAAGVGGMMMLGGNHHGITPQPPVNSGMEDTTAAVGEETETLTQETVTVIVTETAISGVSEVSGTTTSTAQTTMQTSVVTETTIMTDTQPETVTETSQEVCSVPLQTETLTFRTQTIEEPYPGYEDAKMISVVYPQANETSAQAQAINALIEERVQAMLAYCQDAADALREEALQYGYDDLYQNASCSLHIPDYEITRNDADYLSIVWHGEYFLSSAAHPNLFAQGLVIDKHTMTVVSLSDLYKMTPDFYEVIRNEASARTAAALVKKFGGTEADYANAAPSIYEFALPTAGETIIDSHMFALTDSGIIVDAIILHVFGDYVEIHIPFEAIENFRK